MSQKPEDELPSIDAFGERLKKAKPLTARDKLRASEGAAMGQGMKVASELLAAILVGGAIGYGFDQLFGTSPWVLVVGVFVGFAAGIRNAWLASVKMDSARETESLVSEDKKE